MEDSKVNPPPTPDGVFASFPSGKDMTDVALDDKALGSTVAQSRLEAPQPDLGVTRFGMKHRILGLAHTRVTNS